MPGDHLGSRVKVSLPEVDFSQQKALFSELCNDVITVFQPQPDGTEPISLANYFTALDRRDAFIYAWEHFFDDWDVLLCPVAMTTAFEHCPKDTPLLVNGESAGYWGTLSYCAPFNLTGHPAIALPLAQDRNNLPIGVQIVGRRWGEERLLAIAKTLAQLTSGYQRPPGY
jgi:amidase